MYLVLSEWTCMEAALLTLMKQYCLIRNSGSLKLNSKVVTFAVPFLSSQIKDLQLVGTVCLQRYCQTTVFINVILLFKNKNNGMV